MNINEQDNFIWSIADLLRGDFKQSGIRQGDSALYCAASL